ncbi:MAG: VOC family protein [Janthinobacterium lividum]
MALVAAKLTSRRRGVRILRVSRVVADLDRAEQFYRDGLGFRRVGAGPSDPALAELLGVPGAIMQQVVLRLGSEEVALVRFDPPGPAYPADSRSNDGWFQHLAIVAGDLDEAFQRLSNQTPQPISMGGPVVLPPRNGRVSAFKFRDPDGHPLELIHFPPGTGRTKWQRPGTSTFGIDHSAIATVDSARSVRFYRRLGFQVSERSWNYGEAQGRLDGLLGAQAHVTGLRFPEPDGPGLETLAYVPPGRRAPDVPANAVVTDWVTLLCPNLRRGVRLESGSLAALVRDPDGHRIVLMGGSRPAR